MINRLYYLYLDKAFSCNKKLVMDKLPELLVATRNRGKLLEITDILGHLPVTLVDLSHFGISTDIEETGSTFSENAGLKAAGYARLSGVPTLADDSGLVIDALNGRPGVHSARYAGVEATDRERVEKVLSEIRDSQSELRTARFVCAISFANGAQGVYHMVQGVCEGTIVDEPLGELGFGYDPIFRPDGFEQTFGELNAAIKNRISHRSLAFEKIIPFLQGFFKM